MKFPEITKFDHLAIDTETTGLRYPMDRAFMISISTPDGKDYAWDFRIHPQALTWCQKELTRYRGLMIAHNMSFDYKMLYATGIRLRMDNLDDTVTRAVMIDENHGVIYPWTKGSMSYSLDDLGSYYLKIRKDQSFYEKAREFFGDPKMSKKKIMERISELPFEIVAPYAKQDTRVCLDLWEWQEEEINRQGIEKICDFERTVTPELIKAETRGINVDGNKAEQAIDDLEPIINDHQKQLNEIAGFEVNANSSKQVKEIFEPKETASGWVAIDGTPLPSTAKGQPSFGGDTLHNMRHPAAEAIIQLRSTIKTRDTFLKGHILGHMVNSKVYPTINQTASEGGGTRTGRLSYQEPAMQQIPSRNKKVAAIVKPCFLPPQGMKWVDADKQSFEVRVFAHLVAMYNNALAEAYERDPMTDFHQYVADLTGIVRNAQYSGQPNSKQLNLSMIFNSGNGAIADKMGMDWTWEEFDTTDRYTGKSKTIRYKKAGKEAMDVINAYHRNVQGVKKLADVAKNIAETRGYVQTMFGRRLRFRNGYKSYSASGLLIQATAADINKRNWIETGKALGDDGFLMLNTHDSYSMAISEDWKAPYDRVKKALEAPLLRVPLILELSGVGDNWWDALQGVK